MIWRIMQTEVSEGDNILRDLHNYLYHTKAESNKRPYHDTHHFCTRFRIDVVKAMSRGISGGKELIKFADTRNRGRVCLFSQNKTVI